MTIPSEEKNKEESTSFCHVVLNGRHFKPISPSLTNVNRRSPSEALSLHDQYPAADFSCTLHQKMPQAKPSLKPDGRQLRLIFQQINRFLQWRIHHHFTHRSMVSCLMEPYHLPYALHKASSLNLYPQKTSDYWSTNWLEEYFRKMTKGMTIQYAMQSSIMRSLTTAA